MAANYVAREMQAPERLALILPWLNGDVQTPRDTCDAITRFLMPPLGGDRLGLGHADATLLASAAVTPGKLAAMRKALLALLADTVAVRPGKDRPWPSRGWKLRLSFAAFSAARTRPSGPAWEKAPRLTADARRDWLGPGAYRLSVSGPLRDVLLYAVMRTLTEPGAVALARCPAPAADDRQRTCDRWLVALGKRRGRPAKFCSDACRVRTFQQKEK